MCDRACAPCPLPSSWLEPACGFAVLPLSRSSVSIWEPSALGGAAGGWWRNGKQAFAFVPLQRQERGLCLGQDWAGVQDLMAGDS